MRINYLKFPIFFRNVETQPRKGTRFQLFTATEGAKRARRKTHEARREWHDARREKRAARREKHEARPKNDPNAPPGLGRFQLPGQRWQLNTCLLICDCRLS